MDKVNIYINSKNRSISETTSNFNVIIPQGLLRLQPDEYFTLNVNGFYCFNNWYNCLAKFNNQFQLIYVSSAGVKEVLSYEISEGNPNVLQLRTNLNSLLLNHITITYDSIKNTFGFTRVSLMTITRFKLYLNIINAEDFLGCFRKDWNTLIELPYKTEIFSTTPVNINGDEAIIIKIDGDVSISNTASIDNFGDIQFKPSKVIFMKSIDVPSGGLLKYDNSDGGDSFQFRLANTEQITSFRLTVYNQDYELIPNFQDYLFNIQFCRFKKHNEIVGILDKILGYVRDIFMLISNQIFK